MHTRVCVTEAQSINEVIAHCMQLLIDELLQSIYAVHAHIQISYIYMQYNNLLLIWWISLKYTEIFTYIMINPCNGSLYCSFINENFKSCCIHNLCISVTMRKSVEIPRGIIHWKLEMNWPPP